ncbi:MAG: TVP38/TMEM64 family protein [Lentisphaerae bacterium]|nr:TVP38/TMEM64 family protein [Lentisphaerota bacterium]
MPEREPAALSAGADKPAGSRRRTLLATLLVLCLVAFLWGNPGLRDQFSAERIRALTDAMGAFGPIGLILVGAVAPLVFLPRAPICLIAGLLYGIVAGTAVGIVAGTTGAVVQYYLSRQLLAGSAERLTPKRWQQRLSSMRARPFSTILLLRLFPLSNGSLVNMAAGVLRMPLLPYAGATFLGTLPITILYAVCGKAAKQPDPLYMGLATSLLLLLAVSSLLVRRTRWFKRQ